MIYEDTILDKDVERQAAYRRKEYKVYEYAAEFWKEAAPYIDPIRKYVNDDLLPLYCFDKNGEILASMENKKRTYVKGGMIHFKKQAVIRIGIDGFNDILDDDLKRNIRHEIVHYLLWSTDRSFGDDTLEFWCWCCVFDAHAYEKLSTKDKAKYDIFKKAYRYYLKDEWQNIRTMVMLQIVDKVLNEDVDYKGLVKYIKESLAPFYKLFKKEK